MKKISLLFITLLVACTITSAQVTSIIGKWKPIKLEISGLVKADVKKGIVELAEIFLKPEMAEVKKVIEANFQEAIKMMQESEDEYKANGKRISLEKGAIKESDYKFNTATSILTITDDFAGSGEEKEMDFIVEYTDNGFIMTGMMDNPIMPGEKMKVIVEYEKAPEAPKK